MTVQIIDKTSQKLLNNTRGESLQKLPNDTNGMNDNFGNNNSRGLKPKFIVIV